MDRKAWIILIFCSIALVLNFKFLQKNNVDQAENSGDKTEEQGTPTSPSNEDSDESSNTTPEDADKADKVVKEDAPYEIISKIEGQEVTKFTFSNFGGGIKSAEMLLEKNVFDAGNVTLNDIGETVIGALAKSYKDFESTYYERIAQTNESVTYQGELEDGVTVTKVWKLVNGTDEKAPYFELHITFKTKEGKTFDLNKYSITTGKAAPLYAKEQENLAGWFFYEDGDYSPKGQGDFSGGMLSEAKPVVEQTTANLEYFGINSQFFGTAIFPQADAKSDKIWAAGEEILMGTKKRWVFQAGSELPKKTVSSDDPETISYHIFAGVKKNKQMATISDNSDDIMNFSRFSSFAWISDKMNKSLNGIHNWFSADSKWSWGLAIVLLTFFIRIIIWPLHNKSTRTMKRMSKLQPMMKDLRDKYSDNPTKLNQETMKLYRDYGVNPMGGCLPMLIQIPIFFGVFNMINAAVELRGQPFLWVDDLSQPDHLADIAGVPINLLPILMAVTMVIQMRMTPQTGDKLQRRIFMLMPFMFFFFCYNYASALALYWTTQNIVSIGQTWLTQRMPEPELMPKKKGGKPGSPEDDKSRKKGFMERMAEKLEDAQRQRETAAGIAPPKDKKLPGQIDTNKPKKRNPKAGG